MPLAVPVVFNAATSPQATSNLDKNFNYLAAIVVDTVAALRLTTPATPATAGPPRVFLAGYAATGTGGSGWYWYNPADVASADNGFSIIVAADGGRWYLEAVNAAGTSTVTNLTVNGTLVGPAFTSVAAGLAPASGGGTTNFLRADGTWAATVAAPGGANTQIQYNNAGALGGSTLTYTLATGAYSFGAPAAGNITVTVNGVAGTHSMKLADAAAGLFNVGYLECPINAQGTPYTCVLSDSGKTMYYSAAGAAAFTIPSNASVPYPLGTTLTFVNDATGATNMTIAITTDVMVLSPGGTTASRTLAQYGRATAQKLTATRWMISGTGLT
jgi:hypothetical protein